MKEEIKEIIDYISSRTVDDSLLEDYFMQLEDYITNLQDLKHFTTIEIYCELEKRLKDMANMIDELSSKCYDLQEENKIQKEKIEHLLIDLRGESEYKQRNEKAISYMEMMQQDGIADFSDIEHLLNILKGE